MRRLKWIKVQIHMFDDLRIQSILKMRKGQEYVLLLLRLKLLAGDIGDNGLIYMTRDMPATVELLACRFSTTKHFMERALDLFEQYDFISRDEKGMIRILSWDEDQNGDRDQQRREQTRQRVANYRQRQAQEETAPEVDNVPEPETPCPEPAASAAAEESVPDDGPSPIKTYEEAFGQVPALMAQNLHQLEQDWGREAVCNAIHIAAQRGKSHIGYLRGILRNGGGNERSVDRNDGITDLDAYADEMLRRAGEENIFGVDPSVFGLPAKDDDDSPSHEADSLCGSPS